ncbi:MAG: TetR/AcrR family transcriptional regulator [Bacteroidetes Order II. Incertae sedis bacterium]|nr:TetR/AcrR family transcriptional regulator [Bacteroidetes Order II. bacterium]
MEKPSRKQREWQEREVNILDAALQIAKTDGWGGLTIRKIAQRIEYSTPMIYAHFDGKEALLCRLMLMGYERLKQAISLDGGMNAPEVLTKKYLQFALEHNTLYQLMFGLQGAVLNPACLSHTAQAHHELTQHFVSVWKDTTVGLAFLAALHGHISIYLTGKELQKMVLFNQVETLLLRFLALHETKINTSNE